jgi:hypothetical protein
MRYTKEEDIKASGASVRSGERASEGDDERQRSSPNGLRSVASASDQLVRQGTSRVPSTRTASSETSTRTQGSRSVGRFRRELLPVAAVYYQAQGLRLIGRGEWRSALCPFHPDRSPSLRVRVASGGYKCMACGERGGDVLAFHMRRYGLRFVAAAKDLGVWEEVSQ